MRRRFFFLSFITFGLIGGCCKDKNDCKASSFTVNPLIEKYDAFQCNNNNQEYTYVFEKKAQIDSLIPMCFITSPIATPLDDLNMKYLIVGRVTTHRRDTFQTNLFKDTCLKILTYDVSMIQRDTTHWDIPGGVQSIFCSVENIPADYKVEVKYKYVPLP